MAHGLLPGTVFSHLGSPRRLGLSPSFEKLFDSVFETAGTLSAACEFNPNVEITENEASYLVKAELAGISENDVDVVLEDGVLTISGEKSSSHDETKDTLHHTEVSYGKFVRTFRIPSEINEDGISAKFNKGLLEVVIPKAESEKPKAKKIAVSAE